MASLKTEHEIMNYTVAPKPWEERLGNHRVVIEVPKVDLSVKAIIVKIPWRRRDYSPEKKKIIICTKKGKELNKIYRIEFSREKGIFLFEHIPSSLGYYLYYLPFKPQEEHGYFKHKYLKREKKPSKSWLSQVGYNNVKKLDFTKDISQHLKETSIIEGIVIEFQCRTEFDSFYPMEIPFTSLQMEQFLSSRNNDYLVFTEDRKFPIRMLDQIPKKWLSEENLNYYSGECSQNEYFAFQLGIFAVNADLKDISIEFNDLKKENHTEVISKTLLTCFNLEGVDIDGMEFTKQINIPRGRIQPLWIGIDIPEHLFPGLYKGEIIVKPENSSPTPINIEININSKFHEDRGDNEPWRHSRLRWLNSRIGLEESVIPPYTALEVKNSKIKCLGRSVELNDFGLPQVIEGNDTNLLTRSISFLSVLKENSEILKNAIMKFSEITDGKVAWESNADYTNFIYVLKGTMEPDGYIHYEIKVLAKKELEMKDLSLKFDINSTIGSYFMGLGRRGGYTPLKYKSKWKGPYNSFWIGNHQVGVHCKMLGASYSGPLQNLYKPKPPKNWYNKGKGRIEVKTLPNEETRVSINIGSFKLGKDEEKVFEFALIITPVKKINCKSQFSQRYYHSGGTPVPSKDLIKEAKVKVVNVHHANEINPFINYPFLTPEKMKEFIDNMHFQDVKVKLYYTIRELTSRVVELWALRSLDDEILSIERRRGIINFWMKAYPWLIEHLRDNYGPEWYAVLPDGKIDAAILTSGESRWYNYYIEGLGWLIRNLNIDGIYLDDVSYDRRILKRMRRVMASLKPDCIIDLHSNTGFSKGPATQYTEYFPYVDKLWFGESFNYEKMPPDQWFVEVSGIPFGLMGDMLHGGGNRWKGMVYGMTTRLPWVSEKIKADPRPIWKLWDEFGIEDATMLGYWEANCPIKTTHPKVLVTIYQKPGKILISIGNWSKRNESIKLAVNWGQLELDPGSIRVTVPFITDFQGSEDFNIQSSIIIPGNQGKIVILEELNRIK